MSDDPNYWCIVATNYFQNDGWIVHRSDDAEREDIIYDALLSDLGLDDWVSRHRPGLYRLELVCRPDNGEVSVSAIRCLLAFPAVGTAADPCAPTANTIVNDYAAIARAMKS